MGKVAKPKKQQFRRACVFCEGNRNLSREHVFAQWLREYFPKDGSSTHKSAEFSWPDESGPAEAVQKRGLNQGHVRTKTVKVVCETCNNGWLSKLEERAKSALGPLIVGHRSNILIGGQKLIATWAAKTAMVAEHLKKVDSGITQEERSWLMNELSPPEKWFVWISAYSGGDWSGLSIFQNRVAVSLAPVERPSDAPFYAQSTIFVVGRALFCVVSGSSPDMDNQFCRREGEGVVQIWPPQERSILWPSPKILGDPEAYSLANIFSESGAYDQRADPGANWKFSF